ncbi:MAG: hypothetical protein ACI936_000012 [Paraglaciecola sp.]|jgi:hypothetical protein
MLMVEFVVVSNIIQVYKWWVQIYDKGIPVGAEYCSVRLFCELIIFCRYDLVRSEFENH